MQRTWIVLGVLLFACGAEHADPKGESADAQPAETVDGGEGSQSDAEPTQALSGSLRLLTYNVAGLPIGISSSNPPANTPLMSPLLNQYDLVLAQEDFSYHDDLAADAMHPHQSTPMPTTGALAMGDGLNRFSNLPFSDFQREAWNECNGHFDSGSDCLAPKGFSFARHTLAPGVTLDVYNLHADAGRKSDDRQARLDQVVQLVEFINGNSAGNAVLVAGDTNMKQGDEQQLQMLLGGAALSDACTLLACPDPEIIDRLMLRSSDAIGLEAKGWWIDTSFVDQNGLPLSDHQAIGIELSWSIE